MNRDIQELLNADDSKLIYDSVKRVTGQDLNEVTGEINRLIEVRFLPNAIKAQWHLINAMARTIVHLEKQNALMQDDYKRGKK